VLDIVQLVNIILN